MLEDSVGGRGGRVSVCGGERREGISVPGGGEGELMGGVGIGWGE